MKPPLTYYGSKTSVAHHIVRTFPEHGHYVEPFAGSLAVLLAKPRSIMETVNDIDQDLVVFWRVLRDHPTQLARVCALTPHSRIEYEASYHLDEHVDDIERARRVWVRLTQGRGAMMRRTGWRFFRDRAGSSIGMPGYLSAYVDRMIEVAERIQGVSLECRPALDIIKQYGHHKSVLLYVDPPYLGSTRNGGNQYTHEMRGDDDHRELAAALHQCKAHVILSGYPSDLYDNDLYADWERTTIPSRTGNAAGVQERTEVLWRNFSVPDLFSFKEPA